MKTSVLLVLLTACTTHAQTIKPNEMSCGNATLTLSMTQTQAVQTLKEKGYTLTSTSSPDESSLPVEFWINLTDKDLCNVSFANNKLVFVRRYWEKRITDERSAVETVIDAVETIIQPQRENNCSLFSYKNTSPSGLYKALDIECGGRMIRLSVMDNNDFHAYDVEESIGSTLKRP